MTDLEKLEDLYPELRFWSIDVPNPHFHGQIDGHDVYVNSNDDDLTQLKTILHEIYHHEVDYGDLSNSKKTVVLREEGYATRFAERYLPLMLNI
ncbi:hypothetical protein [Limosilactobacillus ingluviei]|uniref:hypothetical protein n=1 Tax=Limosilactobacillus ingluviei TaxID=148604 RepID=UPI0005942668|nr:hypothetical protein [Limosilactobacillus ingluviei]